MNIFRYTPQPVEQKVMAPDESMQTQLVEPLYCTPRGDNGPWFVNGWYFAEDVVREHFDEDTITRDFTPCEPFPTIPYRVANLDELATAAGNLRQWILSDMGQTACRPVDERAIPSGYVPSINGNGLLWDALCELNHHAIRLGCLESHHPSLESSLRDHISETRALSIINRLMVWTDGQRQAEEDRWSAEKSPGDWRRELKINSQSTLNRYRKNGILEVEVNPLNSRLWRISKESLKKFKADKADDHHF